jgi:hypothetical protein
MPRHSCLGSLDRRSFLPKLKVPPRKFKADRLSKVDDLSVFGAQVEHISGKVTHPITSRDITRAEQLHRAGRSREAEKLAAKPKEIW